MNFRELFRGFFGIPPPPPPENQDSRFPLEARSRDDGDTDEWRRVRPPPLDDYGDLVSRRPDKVFGSVFSAVEDMMRDMEQSMKDFDRFFEDFGSAVDGFEQSEAYPPLYHPPVVEEDAVGGCLPPLPRPSTNKDSNMRDLVLKKEKEYPKLSPKDKVDKDLDDVYAKSGLDVSQLPVPSKPEPPFIKELVPSTPSSGFSSSSFQRVYSTYSFNNGKWEGKTVRENSDGREVTTYVRDENGQMNETTEYFPTTRDALPNNPHQGNDLIPKPRDSPDAGYYSPFSLLDKFFKPKL